MSETDRRLKDHLNTNQATRERMCLEILSTMPGYSNVQPRLPKGGPDGGRDLQATYEGAPCLGAVGFVNDATDLRQHRDEISAKFLADLSCAKKAALEEKFDLISFVFFTNVGLTPNIIQNLKSNASAVNVKNCEILDRERIRISLDSSKGYAIRFRYLNIPLSDAEQKDFFYTWSDQISSMVRSGMAEIDITTKRIQFLLEAQMIVDSLSTVVRLDCTLAEASGGEFLFQTTMSFQTHSDGLMAYFYGAGNKPIEESLAEWKARGCGFPKNSQYGYAFAWLLPKFPQHDRFITDDEAWERPSNEFGKEERKETIRIKSSSGILEIQNEFLSFNCISHPFLDRFYPYLKLIDMNGAWILFESSKRLAEHIETISIYANGFEIFSLAREELELRQGGVERFYLPKEADQNQLNEEYVTLRPRAFASSFTIDMVDITPRRYNWG